MKEELYLIQNQNQREINELKDELIKEKRALNYLERNVKREQINYNENLEKKQMELQYEKMGNDMKLDILNSKLNNKKSEIEREKQKLENEKINLLNYQKQEMMYIDNQENDLNKKKKN